MDFGSRLREVRKEQGITAKELAEASGVLEKTIYRIETGEVKDPKLSSIKPLIKALNCSADKLLYDIDSYYDSSNLRQLFAVITNDLNEEQQEFIFDVIQKLNLAFGFENHISGQMAKGNFIREEKKPV